MLIPAILLTYTCLLLVKASNAQEKASTLTGLVKEAVTKRCLPGATITLTNALTSINTKATSTERGVFTVKNLRPGQYTLQVSFIGYDTFIINRVTIGEKQPLIKIEDVFMRLQVNKLKNVVVITTTAKKFIVFSAGKIILNVAQSPLSTGSNAYELLLRAPGVVEQNNELSFRTKSINVLIDDKPTRLSNEELKDMLSSLPSSSIDKIEILPNPSAKYDAQAGSVINIKLTKNKNYGLNGSLTSGVGTGRFLRVNDGVSMNYNSEKLSLYGSYDYQHTRQYYDNRFNRQIEAASNIIQHEYEIRTRNNKAYRVGFDFDINKSNSFGIGLKGYTNYRSKEGNTISSVYSEKIDSFSTVHTNGISRVFNPSVNMYYKAILDSNGTSLTLNADYFSYNKRWQDSFVTEYYNSLGKLSQPAYFLRDKSPAEINTYSIAADYFQPSFIGKIDAGFKNQFTISDNNILWQQQTEFKWLTDSTKTNHFIYKENVNAGYLTVNKTIKRFNFVVGIRAEQTNLSGDLVNTQAVSRHHYLNIFPNASAEYAKNLDNVIDVSYRKSIQRFGFNLINPFILYQSQYAYYQGNAKIQPELDHNLEVSYSYKRSLVFGASFTHGINALAPVYLKGDNNSVISTFANLKSSNLFYIYLDFTRPLTDWWSLYLSGGTGFLKYNTATSALTGPRNNASWTYLIQTENTFKFGDNWTGELNGNYRGPYTSGIYKAALNFTAGAGISKVLFNKRATLKLAVQDIFNTDKQGLKINYQGVIMKVTNKAETQFLNASISWKIGKKNSKTKKKAAPTALDDIKERVNLNQ